MNFLTDDEVEELSDLYGSQYGDGPLGQFIAKEFPNEPPPPHLVPLIELLDRARHERVFACISMPPRHGKTVTILRAIVKWLLDNPADTLAYATFSTLRSRSKSKLCRKWARQCGVAIDSDFRGVDEWRTPEGGGLLSGGLQAGFTGQGVSGIFIVDDPFKNRSEADSEVIRDKVFAEFNDVVLTRLEGASVIVMHTRWHEDDLIGRLISGDSPWEYINIAAIAGEDDILGRNDGEALWEDRHPRAELDWLRRNLGERSFAALYQGSPTSEGGNIIKREDIRYYDVLPEGLRDYVQSWDLTFKGKEDRSKKGKKDKGSYVVGQVWARSGPDCYLLDQFRGKPDFHDTKLAIKAMSAKWPQAIAKLVEDAANGPAILSDLKNIPGMIAVPTKGQSKAERLHLCSPLFRSHNVWLPRWADGVVEETVSFPTGTHDDQMDALSMALNNYLQSFCASMEIDLEFGLKEEKWDLG